MRKIILYSTPTCPYCMQAKQYLQKRDIPFTEKDITRDQQARQELASRNVSGVPAFLVDNELVVGFDKKRLEQLLMDLVVQCPACMARLRLPSGKGRLRITCSQCGHKFNYET